MQDQGGLFSGRFHRRVTGIQGALSRSRWSCGGVRPPPVVPLDGSAWTTCARRGGWRPRRAKPRGDSGRHAQSQRRDFRGARSAAALLARRAERNGGERVAPWDRRGARPSPRPLSPAWRARSEPRTGDQRQAAAGAADVPEGFRGSGREENGQTTATAGSGRRRLAARDAHPRGRATSCGAGGLNGSAAGLDITWEPTRYRQRLTSSDDRKKRQEPRGHSSSDRYP